jgi:hypothetical protein
MKQLSLGIILAMAVNVAHADSWDFMIEPYLLASSIDGEADVGRVTGVPVEVDFEKILETLSMGAMVHFEAHNENGWGFIVDYGFMDLEDDISTPRGGVIATEVSQGVAEALVVRRTDAGNGSLDFLAGLRWWDNDVKATFDPAILPGSASTDLDEDWFDVVVGVRYTAPLTGKLDFSVRADVGGAGVESEFTWNLSATGIYSINDTAAIEFGYKGLFVDYEDGSRGSPERFAYRTTTHGPVIGLQLAF